MLFFSPFIVGSLLALRPFLLLRVLRRIFPNRIRTSNHIFLLWPKVVAMLFVCLLLSWICKNVVRWFFRCKFFPYTAFLCLIFLLGSPSPTSFCLCLFACGIAGWLPAWTTRIRLLPMIVHWLPMLWNGKDIISGFTVDAHMFYLFCHCSSAHSSEELLFSMCAFAGATRWWQFFINSNSP